MGSVLVTARIDNLTDLFGVKHGIIAADAARFVEVTDALIDTGATGLSLPKTLLERLGLDYLRTRRARTSAGDVEVRVFGTVRLTIQGRDCPCDVTELPDGGPVLIGQIPLEALDFVVDLGGRRLIGNPAHGGEHIIDLYSSGF